MKLYQKYAEWWPLLSAPEEYEEEATIYSDRLQTACQTPPKTLLELGSGGGNNAFYMKHHFNITCVDLAEPMLAVSRRLNPECEHLVGDMRTVRLNRFFDAVFIHDAIGYMTSLEDLAQALQTAYAHCRPGGAALFVPDYTAETFRSATHHGGHDGPDQSLRYLQWDHQPEPQRAQYRIDFTYLLQEGGHVQAIHDTHYCGLFTRAQWFEQLDQAGFSPEVETLECDEFEVGYYQLFIGKKPTQ